MGYSLTLAHGPGVLIVLAIVVAPAVVRALVKRVFETATADIVQPYLSRALPELCPHRSSYRVVVPQLLTHHLVCDVGVR